MLEFIFLPRVYYQSPVLQRLFALKIQQSIFYNKAQNVQSNKFTGALNFLANENIFCWDEIFVPQMNISGTYHLSYHSSEYSDYLLAMDIPQEAVKHILTG